MYTSY